MLHKHLGLGGLKQYHYCRDHQQNVRVTKSKATPKGNFKLRRWMEYCVTSFPPKYLSKICAELMNWQLNYYKHVIGAVLLDVEMMQHYLQDPRFVKVSLGKDETVLQCLHSFKFERATCMENDRFEHIKLSHYIFPTRDWITYSFINQKPQLYVDACKCWKKEVFAS